MRTNFAPEWSTYKAMLGRCHNRKHKSFDHYGAKGVVVCDRWRLGNGERTGFDLFVMDMGLRPPGTSLDRIDGRGIYERSNCRWSSATEQTSNRKPLNEFKQRKCRTSKYRNVRLRKGLKSSRWQGYLHIERKYVGVGHFATALAAALEADRVSYMHFRDLKRLNFPERYSHLLPPKSA